MPNTSTRAKAQAELSSIDAFYAVGKSWLAAPEQTDAVSGEQSVVQDVALALAGLVEPGRPNTR